MAEKMGWTIELAGSEHALVPAVPALVTIERATGRTLFGLVDRSRSEGFALTDMAVIAIALAGVKAPAESELATLYEALSSGLTGAPVERMTAMLADAGLVQVSARLLPPLVAALSGGVDAEGVTKG